MYTYMRIHMDIYRHFVKKESFSTTEIYPLECAGDPGHK